MGWSGREGPRPAHSSSAHDWLDPGPPARCFIFLYLPADWRIRGLLLVSRTGAALDLDGNVVDVPQGPLVTLATQSLSSSHEGNSSFPFLALNLNLNGLLSL